MVACDLTQIQLVVCPFTNFTYSVSYQLKPITVAVWCHSNELCRVLSVMVTNRDYLSSIVVIVVGLPCDVTQCWHDARSSSHVLLPRGFVTPVHRTLQQHVAGGQQFRDSRCDEPCKHIGSSAIWWFTRDRRRPRQSSGFCKFIHQIDSRIVYCVWNVARAIQLRVGLRFSIVDLQQHASIYYCDVVLHAGELLK